MTECIFCNIINGRIPAEFTYKDEEVVVFDDLNAKAPHHKLIVPREHIATLNNLSPTRNPTGHMIVVATQVAKKLGIDGPGYRLVINCNADAGQSVFHIHAHLLGGRHLTWPPG